MRNEMDKMKQLNNDYILKVHYFFRQFDHGNWYDCIVMDLYDMNFFEYKIKREQTDGRMSTNDCEKFITCLFEATEVLFEEKIQHLDIKPNNFLLKLTNGSERRIDKIVLADFGQAKMMNEETNWYNKCGNPLFAPPESWSGDTTNRDQWGMATSFMFGIISTKAFYGLMILPYQRSYYNLQSLFPKVAKVRTPKRLLDLYMNLIKLNSSNRLSIMDTYNRMKLCKEESQFMYDYAESERVSNSFERYHLYLAISLRNTLL